MTGRSSRRHVVAVALLAAIGAACSGPGLTDDGYAYDDWGVAGYARLAGTVSHADGTRYGVVSVFYMCGDPDPTWFGNSATTATDGSFDIAVDAPMKGTLPASGTLVCEVRTSGASPTAARARATVPFSQSADTRPVTTFTLVDGQGSP